MRSVESVDELLKQVEYFVDTVSDYQSDFILFPEFFNMPLMGIQEHRSQTEAIRFLAEYTSTLVDAMSRMAVEYNANIITGSMPVLIKTKALFIMSVTCAIAVAKWMNNAKSILHLMRPMIG